MFCYAFRNSSNTFLIHAFRCAAFAFQLSLKVTTSQRSEVASLSPWPDCACRATKRETRACCYMGPGRSIGERRIHTTAGSARTCNCSSSDLRKRAISHSALRRLRTPRNKLRLSTIRHHCWRPAAVPTSARHQLPTRGTRWPDKGASSCAVHVRRPGLRLRTQDYNAIPWRSSSDEHFVQNAHTR